MAVAVHAPRRVVRSPPRRKARRPARVAVVHASVLGRLAGAVGRLVRSAIGGATDALEDPEVVLKQAVDDMAVERQKVAQALAGLKSSSNSTRRQIARAEHGATSWLARAQLAVAKGDEALARQALQRRQADLSIIAAREAQLREQAVVEDKLRDSLLTYDAKLAEARGRKDTLVARAQQAKLSAAAAKAVAGLDSTSALAAFERLEQKVERLEAEAEALAELPGAADPLAAAFARLESEPAVESELRRLKQAARDGSRALPDVLAYEEGVAPHDGSPNA